MKRHVVPGVFPRGIDQMKETERLLREEMNRLNSSESQGVFSGINELLNLDFKSLESLYEYSLSVFCQDVEPGYRWSSEKYRDWIAKITSEDYAGRPVWELFINSGSIVYDPKLQATHCRVVAGELDAIPGHFLRHIRKVVLHFVEKVRELP